MKNIDSPFILFFNLSWIPLLARMIQYIKVEQKGPYSIYGCIMYGVHFKTNLRDREPYILYMVSIVQFCDFRRSLKTVIVLLTTSFLFNKWLPSIQFQNAWISRLKSRKYHYRTHCSRNPKKFMTRSDPLGPSTGLHKVKGIPLEAIGTPTIQTN